MDSVTGQSGNYNVSSHISKRWSPLIRYALYVSTISSIKYNPVAKRYYDYKKGRGLNDNKLLNIIYSVIKNNNNTDFKEPEIIN